MEDEYLVVLLFWIRQLQKEQQVPLLYFTAFAILKPHSLFILCHHPLFLHPFLPFFTYSICKGKASKRIEARISSLLNCGSMCGMCMCVGIIKARGERVTQKEKQPCFMFLFPTTFAFFVLRKIK